VADRAAGKHVQCPVLVLWATRDDMEELYGDPLEVWRAWAPDLRAGPIESGHHLAEEAPDALVAQLRGFLSASR
jgi:haloacetate dehalogenase